MEEKKIEQPEVAFEKALNSVIEDKEESVVIRGKKFKIKDLRKAVRRKLTDLELEHKEELEYPCKCAAAITCNSFWSLAAFWGLGWALRWRWYYYVKQYTTAELLPLIRLAKKKAEKEMLAYTLSTILVTAMKDTTMTMTKQEAKRIQAEKAGEQHGQPPKNLITSREADSSSEG